MSHDKDKVELDAIRKRIAEMVSKEFGEASRESVAAALSEVLGEIESSTPVRNEDVGVGEDASNGWTGRITSNVVNALVPRPVREDAEALPSITIEANSTEHVASLLHQILQVGAVLVTLDESPPLNAIVQLCLNFTEAHLGVETRGRVVHKSERGTAVEVSSLNKEDRAALQGMYDDHLRSLEDAANEADDGNARRAESGSTLSGPPTGPRSAQGSEGDDDSFAPYGSGTSTGRSGSTTSRRRVDLPDPDPHVLTSTDKAQLAGSATREFYGPAPPWLKADGDPDRIEELAKDRVLDILLQLSESGFTGVMEYEGATLSRQIYLDSGCVVEVTRSPRVAEEELGPMLKAADRITKRQLAMAAANADESDITIERSLLELGILGTEPIRHAIAGRLTYLLREIGELKQGQVRLYASPALPTGFLPSPPLRVHVAVERIIFERLVKRLGSMTLAEREVMLEQDIESYPETVPEDRDRVERAVIGVDHRRLLDRVVNGRRRLKEVLTESGLPPAETFAVIYALHRMGLLRFDRSLHQTVVRERYRENVTVKYLSVHKASYFEVINVHWSSYDEVVDKAYGDLVKQFDPATVPDAMESEVSERVSEIRERIEAAYKVLANRPQRHAYRIRIMPEYKLAHAIPLFLKQSELAERRSQWSSARDAIRRVLEIDPEHVDGKRRLERLDGILNKNLSPDPKDSNF